MTSEERAERLQSATDQAICHRVWERILELETGVPAFAPGDTVSDIAAGSPGEDSVQIPQATVEQRHIEAVRCFMENNPQSRVRMSAGTVYFRCAPATV